MKLHNVSKGKTFVVPLAILVALSLLLLNEGAYWQSKRSMDSLLSRASSREVLLNLTENLVNIESRKRGYVLTGNEALLKPVDVEKQAIAMAFESLARQHSQDAQLLAALLRMNATVAQRIAKAQESVQLRRAGQAKEAIDLALQSVGTMDEIHALDNELMALENTGRDERRATVYQTFQAARIGMAVFITLGLLAFLVYLRQARQLLRHQNELLAIEAQHRSQLEAEVAQRTTELTDLMSHLQDNRDDERNRLARNLHDDLGALLTSAKLDAARLKPRLASAAPEALELLAHLVTNLNACVALGRDIIENLRPSALSNLGLVATLEILTREFSESSGVKVHCQLAPVALDASTELIVFRVVQEALTNIAKYANASQVWVDLGSQGKDAIVTVRDNGVGFDTNAKPSAGFGLLGMRFRVEAAGGTLSVSASAGTTVQAKVKQRPAPAET